MDEKEFTVELIRRMRAALLRQHIAHGEEIRVQAERNILQSRVVLLQNLIYWCKAESEITGVEAMACNEEEQAAGEVFEAGGIYGKVGVQLNEEPRST
jgi:hypothetical protein